MDNFLQFFELMPVWQKLLWILICLNLAWIFEGVIPLVSLNYKKWKHAGVNLIFLLCSMIINVLFGVLTLGVFHWISLNEFGMLYLFEAPVWVELLISLLLLDFIAQFGIHFLLHKVNWMWGFHKVHHSDTKVDATTGTRHHPGDYLIRELAALFAVFIAGMPLSFYLFYKIITVFFTYFTHANIRLPSWLDRSLSWIIVTPDMHKFHHHHEVPWTDSNYGNIFSIWDRIFGTFVYEDPSKVTYGLDILDGEKDEDLLFQMKVPFKGNAE